MKKVKLNFISVISIRSDFRSILIITLFFLASFIFQACSNPDWKLVEKKNGYRLFRSKKSSIVRVYKPISLGHGLIVVVKTKSSLQFTIDNVKYSGPCPNTECRKGHMDIDCGKSAKCDFCSAVVEVIHIYKTEITTNDQQIIENLARNHTNKSVRRAATSKITDQAVLAEIALSYSNVDAYESDFELYEDAYKKITDQEQLSKIAKNHIDAVVREDATKKLTNQDALAEIAKNDSYQSIRKVAVEKLVDKELLKKIGQNDPSRDVRKAANIRLAELD